MQHKSIINHNLRWFLAGMIFANIAGQMAYSMLALYMLDLGASVTQVGMAFTLASLVPMVLQIFGGWLSDTIGRLRVIAMGSSIAVFGYLIFAFAPNWQWVLIGLSVEYVSNSVVGPSFGAYISEQSTEETRGRVFGLSSGIYQTVTVIGPALAGFLAYQFNFQFMMRVAFCFYLAATLLRVWMANNERFASLKEAAKPTLIGFKGQLTAVFALLLSGGILTWIWITDAVGDTSYNLIGQLFPIYLSDFGELNVQQIGIVNAAIGITAIFAAPLAGSLVDKFSERAAIITGFALNGLGLFTLLNSNSYSGFILAMCFFGLGTGCLMPAYESLISKVVPESKRGMAFGFFGTTLGLLSLPMPWIGAQLWERFSPRTPFWFAVAANMISIIFAWFKFIPQDSQPAELSGK
ncbi:MFS transporter [Candidatus Villigracilis saccharophilus]|uniref:MFS transporter n=1 Tax=Candidatus Villigracilis saccharophilus TaxID=3140684 RepID=UPI003136D812|nr:MFS transporter [Anaerolineales bacterium]